MILAVALLAFPVAVQAQEKGRLHFGAEWGFSFPVISGTHSTFLAEEGYLVDSKELRVNGHLNALAMGSVGIDISRRFGIYALAGYMGVTKGERVIPVTLRGIYSCSGELTGNRIYIEAGGGFRSGCKVTGIARIGYIYSCGLTERLALTFNAGSIVSFSHPEVYDKYSGRYVPKPSLGLSNSLNAGVVLTIGLAF